jgi:hypothetical protein
MSKRNYKRPKFLAVAYTNEINQTIQPGQEVIAVTSAKSGIKITKGKFLGILVNTTTNKTTSVRLQVRKKKIHFEDAATGKVLKDWWNTAPDVVRKRVETGYDGNRAFVNKKIFRVDKDDITLLFRRNRLTPSS